MKQVDGLSACTTAISRRSLCIGVGGVAVMAGLGALRLVPREPLVRPPGGQDEARLVAGCVRCAKCAEVCPRNAIKLAHVEEGVLAMRTPQMNFYSDYCDFCVEENGGVPLCAAACPTGALQPSDEPIDPTEREVVIGVAHLERDWCLAYYDTGCHICYDACVDEAGFDAIELDEHRRPYVVEDKCNGCGACEAACVSLTAGSRSIAGDAAGRAIRVMVEG